MCRTRVAWHQGLTVQVCVVRVMKSFPSLSHERAFLIPRFTSPSLLSCTSCPTSPAPLSDNPATIHDQEGTVCPPGRTTSHNVRPVTPSLRWITLRHRVPLSPLGKGETLPENWWCIELTLRCKGPTGAACPLTTTEARLSFFSAHWHRDGGSVRRGRDPARSREHHEPKLHAFCR